MLDSQVIERCKRQIAYRASMAGLKFLQDDIICTQERDGSHVVFLRRYFLGYLRDEEGNHILNDDLEPFPDFQPTAWFEYCAQQMPLLNPTPLRAMEAKIPIPRLIMPVPWVFFHIKSDVEVVDGGNPCSSF